MEHVPTVRIVTGFPETGTVHTDVVVEVKETANVDDALALTLNGETPIVTLGRALKVMVCGAANTVKLWTTGVAAE